MRTSRVRIVAILFALAIGLGTLRKADSLHSPDFKVFYVAARHVLVDPANLYRVSPDRYLYPPSAAILLTPFALTDQFPIFQWAWHTLLTLLLAGLCLVSGPALAAMVVLTRYLLNTFPYGQINLVVLALLAAAGALLERKKVGPSGGLWAVATGFKIYPAVFGFLFLPKEARRGLAVGFGVGIFLLALPFLAFGPALALQLYGEFLAALRSKGLPLDGHNQSLQALFTRLFGGAPVALDPALTIDWTVAALPPALIHAAAYAVGGVLAGCAWKKAFSKQNRTEAFLSAGAFSVLFLSHIVWKDYLLFLYFPLRELFAELPRKRALALGAGLLALLTLSSRDVVGWPLSFRLDGACIHLGGAVLVWAVWMRRK